MALSGSQAVQMAVEESLKGMMFRGRCSRDHDSSGSYAGVGMHLFQKRSMTWKDYPTLTERILLHSYLVSQVRLKCHTSCAASHVSAAAHFCHDSTTGAGLII